MSDLVERLRNDCRPHCYWDLRMMAADEIERLQSEARSIHAGVELRAQEYRREIERLREALEKIASQEGHSWMYQRLARRALGEAR